MSKAGEKIIAGLEDAIRFAQGDQTRAKVHKIVVRGDPVATLVRIARGVDCKRPLPAADAQRLAKDALTSMGLDWV